MTYEACGWVVPHAQGPFEGLVTIFTVVVGFLLGRGTALCTNGLGMMRGPRIWMEEGEMIAWKGIGVGHLMLFRLRRCIAGWWVFQSSW